LKGKIKKEEISNNNDNVAEITNIQREKSFFKKPFADAPPTINSPPVFPISWNDIIAIFPEKSPIPSKIRDKTIKNVFFISYLLNNLK